MTPNGFKQPTAEQRDVALAELRDRLRAVRSGIATVISDPNLEWEAARTQLGKLAYPPNAEPVGPGAWQPMETAPKDGTVMLGWNGHAYALIHWWQAEALPALSCWMISGESDKWKPTAWMPLPPAPDHETGTP